MTKRVKDIAIYKRYRTPPKGAHKRTKEGRARLLLWVWMRRRQDIYARFS